MNTILDAFKNSDSVGQAIVLLLIAASCLCWSIVGNKRFDTRNKVRQCKRFLERFGKFHFNERLRIFGELDKMKAKEPLVALTLAVREALLSTLNLNSEQRRLLLDDGKLPRPLIQSELDALRVALNREMTVQVIQMESGLTLMGTIIALAPCWDCSAPYGASWRPSPASSKEAAARTSRPSRPASPAHC